MSTIPSISTGNFKGLRDEIKQLQEEGAKLEAQYHASHAALYALLEHAFDILTRATNEDQVEELVALSEKWAKEHKHEFRSKSDPELRLVTMVFAGAAKQRLNTYANVLRAARGREADGKSFAQWIASRGGVQEISYSVAAPIDEEERKAAFVKLVAEVAAIKGTALSLRFKEGAPRGMPVVLFGFVRDDGTVVLLASDFDLETVRPHALKAVKKYGAKKAPAEQKPAEPKKKPETTFGKFFFEVQDGGRSGTRATDKKVA